MALFILLSLLVGNSIAQAPIYQQGYQQLPTDLVELDYTGMDGIPI
jgi:hypothetical protein